MSDPKQYDDVIGMLTDQCHQYALEVERLKAKPHDDDTCPHLVVLGRLEAENARLKAEVERLTKAGDAMLKAIKVTDPILDWKIELWNDAKEGMQP